MFMKRRMEKVIGVWWLGVILVLLASVVCARKRVQPNPLLKWSEYYFPVSTANRPFVSGCTFVTSLILVVVVYISFSLVFEHSAPAAAQ